MAKPEEYKHIAAWGRFMASFDYYVKSEQQKAAVENAPVDAIFKRDNEWHRFQDVTNPDTRATVEKILQGLQ